MKELLNGQSLTTISVSTSGISGNGTRVFVEGGAETLPSIGDSFYDAIDDATHNNIIAVSITEVPFQITDGLPNPVWSKKYVVDYGTLDSSYSYTQTPPEEAEGWSGGAGSFSIENPNGNWREYTGSGLGPLTAGTDLKNYDAMTGRVVMNYATGIFTKTKAVLAVNKASTIANFLSVAGKLNDATFDGFVKGQVLCESMDGSTRVRGDGLTEYLFTIRYHWKVIANTGETGDDWQFAWSKNNGWVRPALGDAETGGVSTSGFIYEYDSIDIF